MVGKNFTHSYDFRVIFQVTNNLISYQFRTAMQMSDISFFNLSFSRNRKREVDQTEQRNVKIHFLRK